MANGKTYSRSEKVYRVKKNSGVKNTVFDRYAKAGSLDKREIIFKERIKENASVDENGNHRDLIKYKERVYVKFNKFGYDMFNSSGYVAMTRNPNSVCEGEAIERFKNLIEKYNNEEITLATLSKEMITYRMLEDIEAKEAIVVFKDDSCLFLIYKFSLLESVKIALYKIFYPRIFDYELIDDKKQLLFYSPYIKKNFLKIFKSIEKLSQAIIIDSMIIAIEDYILNQLFSLKKSKIKINPENPIDEMHEYLQNQINATHSPRERLASHLIPSIVFLSRYYKNVYDNSTDNPDNQSSISEKSDALKKDHKTIITLLQQPVFYTGSRETEVLGTLAKTYADCKEMLGMISDPITKLLNLYYINKKTNIYDFLIMSKNVEFAPYAICGIATKHHINEMIISNNQELQKTLTNNSELSLIYNDPNCIISNISPRDYEIIDSLIKRTSKTFSEYYFKKDDQTEKDKAPEKLREMMDALKNDRNIQIVNDMINTMTHDDIGRIDTVDYNLVMHFRDDEVKG